MRQSLAPRAPAPAEYTDNPHDVEYATPNYRDEDYQSEQLRKGHHQLGEAHQYIVDPPPEVP